MKMHTLLTITAGICLMMTLSASAQSQNIITLPVTAGSVFTGVPQSNGAVKIDREVAIINTVKEQVAESKIQKRKRRKQDPILIPYRLNKKNFSLS